MRKQTLWTKCVHCVRRVVGDVAGRVIARGHTKLVMDSSESGQQHRVRAHNTGQDMLGGDTNDTLGGGDRLN